MSDFVTIVSGVPRSGTSLMMRMLDLGGIPAFTDGLRSADDQNPHGYFEYEPVKKLAQDSSWVVNARGKALKVIYPLLASLPPDIEYRVLFMERNLFDVFESQREMLLARERDAGDRVAGNQDPERVVRAFSAAVQRVRSWLDRKDNFKVLAVPYEQLVREPHQWASEVSRFLGGALDEDAMARAADISLHHHRSGGTY